jgi:hypothetical protein
MPEVDVAAAADPEATVDADVVFGAPAAGLRDNRVPAHVAQVPEIPAVSPQAQLR